jgi:hypothetical protein
MILGATDPAQSNNWSGPPSSEALDVLVPPQVVSITYSGRPFRSILVFLSLRLILGFGFVAVTVEKKFVLRRPQTLYRIPETGRQALSEYVQALKQLLGPTLAPLLTTVSPVAYPFRGQVFSCLLLVALPVARLALLECGGLPPLFAPTRRAE